MRELLVGAHTSLGRDPRLSLQEAAAHGVRCIQIFASSPGAWKPPILTDLRVEELAAARRDLGVNPLVIHAIYLINLASADRGLVGRSKASLVATLKAGAALNAAAVITHIGSHAGRGFDDVKEQIAGALMAILEVASVPVDLALENSAGAGGIIGSTIDELSELLDLAGNPDRLKIALDTAHLCAAGWDFKEPDAARRLTEKVEACIGIERVVALHANDSRAAVGTRRDRHECVGEGHIGLKGFRNLLHQEQLLRLPWILETPDLGLPEGAEGRFRSVAALCGLASEEDVCCAGYTAAERA